MDLDLGSSVSHWAKDLDSPPAGASHWVRGLDSRLMDLDLGLGSSVSHWARDLDSPPAGARVLDSPPAGVWGLESPLGSMVRRLSPQVRGLGSLVGSRLYFTIILTRMATQREMKI